MTFIAAFCRRRPGISSGAGFCATNRNSNATGAEGRRWNLLNESRDCRMIKITLIEPRGGYRLLLRFSDASEGERDFSSLVCGTGIAGEAVARSGLFRPRLHGGRHRTGLAERPRSRRRGTARCDEGRGRVACARSISPEQGAPATCRNLIPPSSRRSPDGARTGPRVIRDHGCKPAGRSRIAQTRGGQVPRVRSIRATGGDRPEICYGLFFASGRNASPPRVEAAQPIDQRHARRVPFVYPSCGR